MRTSTEKLHDYLAVATLVVAVGAFLFPTPSIGALPALGIMALAGGLAIAAQWWAHRRDAAAEEARDALLSDDDWFVSWKNLIHEGAEEANGIYKRFKFKDTHDEAMSAFASWRSSMVSLLTESVRDRDLVLTFTRIRTPSGKDSLNDWLAIGYHIKFLREKAVEMVGENPRRFRDPDFQPTTWKEYSSRRGDPPPA